MSHYPSYGGPHNRILNLAPGLQRSGWETTVVLPAEPGAAGVRFRDAGIPVVELDMPRIRIARDPRLHFRYLTATPRACWQLRRTFRQVGADLVIAVGVENLHGQFAASMAAVPVVTQIVGTQLPPLASRIMTPLALGLSAVVMTTGSAITSQYPAIARSRKPWLPFFSPVDLERFRPNAELRMAARAELGVAEDAFVVGNVSNLIPPKGHRRFLAAAAELRRRGAEATFVILGEELSTHADYARELRSEAERLGFRLGDDLKIVAPGTRVSLLAQAFDVFWLTSERRGEGVPTVVLEAMAMALPIVAADVAGVGDAVRDGDTGVLVSPDSHEGFVSATEVLMIDADRRRELAARARTRAEDTFGIESCLRVHLKAFESAMRVGASRVGRLIEQTGANK